MTSGDGARSRVCRRARACGRTGPGPTKRFTPRHAKPVQASSVTRGTDGWSEWRLLIPVRASRTNLRIGQPDACPRQRCPARGPAAPSPCRCGAAPLAHHRALSQPPVGPDLLRVVRPLSAERLGFDALQCRPPPVGVPHHRGRVADALGQRPLRRADRTVEGECRELGAHSGRQPRATRVRPRARLAPGRGRPRTAQPRVSDARAWVRLETQHRRWTCPADPP
jgi:hypothetical protein